MSDARSREYHLTTEAKLGDFVRDVLQRVGISAIDAATVADVLVAADLRGIESHGVARLDSYYVARLRAGTIAATPTVSIVRETPTSIVLDAGNGLGHPAARRTMLAVIAKAEESGVAFGAVTHSNHYGIAGYYAMLALERDMIGIASTDTAPLAAPTFGKDALVGTNPWAYAIPARREPAFVLDFATTTVPRGKIEVYERTGRSLAPGWAIDARGTETLDPRAALAGALLPLGGAGMEGGGHKGYGLALLAEIMCAALSGDGATGTISHFFGAIRIDGFRDVAAFKDDMDTELRAFKDSQTAPGVDRIYVAGEIEHERSVERRANGIPVHRAVWADLERLARELGVPFALAR